MEDAIQTAVLGGLLGSGVLAASLLYVTRLPEAPRGVGWWAAGFALHTLRYGFALSAPVLGAAQASLLTQTLQALVAVCLLAGTARYLGHSVRPGWVGAVALAIVAWAATFVYVHPDFFLLTFPLYLLGGLALFVMGAAILRKHPGYARSGHVLVGVSLIVWGLHKLNYPFVRPIDWLAPAGYLLAQVLSIAVVVGLIIMVQRRQQITAQQALAQAASTEVALHEHEHLLAAKNAQLQAILDHVSQGISLVDRNLNVLAYNQQFLRLLELPGELFRTGTTFADVIRFNAQRGEYGPGDVETLVRERVELARQFLPHHLERERPDGTVIEIHGNPLPQGGFVTTYTDVTERHRAEAALRDSEARYRSLVELIPDIVAVHSDRKLVFINDAGAAQFGAPSRESLLGRDVTEFVHPDDHALLAGRMQALQEGQREVPPVEERFVRLDGTPFEVEVMARTMTFAGRPAVLVLARNISERKRVEEQLRQSQKMEAIGQLTGGVAHDFRNLLQVVLGNLEILRERVGDDALRELAGHAIAAVNRGAMLTQRLLAFSRKQALAPEPTDVNEVIHSLTDLLERSLGETIQVQTALEPGLPLAMVDRNQLENALLNLAVNARDAMPGGGTLTIRTHDGHDAPPPGAPGSARPPAEKWVRIAVSDTGCGMAPEVLEHVFEPFYTTKEVGAGSGLGLSMIYGFAQQSGGTVEIQSAPGTGTTVELFLPRTVAAGTPAGAAANADRPAGRAETILIVEDNEPVRELMVSMLQRLGYDTLHAADALSALAVLEDHEPPALLLTDVVLPGGMSGVELVHHARTLQPGLRALLVSGYARGHVAGTEEELGLNLLEKPFRIDELARKLDALFNEPPAERV